MEARRFDAVAKALGTDRTRRRVLRGLVAGIGGGALIGLTGRQASADKCCKELRRSLKADCRACGGHFSKFDCRATEAPGTCGALSECSGCDEEAATHDGAAAGRLGGRHGPNRRGRDRNRSHRGKKGDKKDRHKKARDNRAPGNLTGLRDCTHVPKAPGADLSNCNLRGVTLSNANLENANLENANLSGANLRGAILVGAILFKAILVGAILFKANLTFADLEDADLTDATLRFGNLSGANLMFTFFCRTVMPDGSTSNRDCPGG